MLHDGTIVDPTQTSVTDIELAARGLAVVRAALLADAAGTVRP